MTTTLEMTRPSAAPPTAVGIPFRRLLRVEWIKATDTRSARWLLLITALATIGLALVPAISWRHSDQTWLNYFQHAMLPMSLLLPIIAIQTMANEWTQRTVLTTYVQEPRRERVFAAKTAVALILSIIGFAFTALVAGLTLFGAEATGRDVSSAMTSAALIGLLLVLVLNVLTGVAFGALFQNATAAIVLYFALPSAFSFLASAIGRAGEWIDPSQSMDWMLHGEWSGHAGQMLVSTGLWIALPFVLAVARTMKRDIV